MRLLNGYPEQAALQRRDDELRGEAPGELPRLERWDLVESRWNLGSVLVLLAGAALAVIGLVAAARTGINETWYRPIDEVGGIRHTPLLGAIEAGVGLVLVMAGLAGARGFAAFVCVAVAIAAGVAAIEPGLFDEQLAMQRWWSLTLATAGAGLAVLSMVPWPHFVERHYTLEAGAAESAATGASGRPDQLPGPEGHEAEPG